MAEAARSRNPRAVATQSRFASAGCCEVAVSRATRALHARDYIPHRLSRSDLSLGGGRPRRGPFIEVGDKSCPVSGDQLCQRWIRWLEGKSYCYQFTLKGKSVRWVRNDGVSRHRRYRLHPAGLREEIESREWSGPRLRPGEGLCVHGTKRTKSMGARTPATDPNWLRYLRACSLAHRLQELNQIRQLGEAFVPLASSSQRRHP